MSRRPLAAPALLLAGAVLVLLTFRDYGITWDETVQARYGEEVLDYFLSGFRDTRCNELTNMRHYGPLFDTAAAALARAWPSAKVEIRHLLGALLGLAAVAGLYRFARRLASPAVAVTAALFLVTLPRFYGDWFNNPKDIPFACAFTWFLAAVAGVVDRGAYPLRSVAACGALLGWVGASRSGGIPLALLVAGAGACWAAGARLEARPFGARGFWGRLGLFLGVAWLVMVLPWPWAHQAPIVHPVRSMRKAAAFSERYDVLFAGRTLPSDQLPRTYPLHFLAIATPLGTLALAAAGVAAAVRAQRRDPRAARAAVLFVAQAWLVVPLVLFVVVRPNVYDGIRHFLFVLPALALFAALGAESLVAAVRPRWARMAAAGLVGAALVAPAVAMIRLHPYQSTYFNLLVGGVRGASGRYETDYWASAYKEAAEWINRNRKVHPDRPTTVLVAANPYSITCATYYLAPDVVARRFQARGARGALPANADYFIGSTRWELDQNFPDSPIAYRVERLGATFAVVRGQP